MRIMLDSSPVTVPLKKHVWTGGEETFAKRKYLRRSKKPNCPYVFYTADNWDTYFKFINTISLESDFMSKEVSKLKRKEAVGNNTGFTCPNPSCGRAFAKSIKTKNISQKGVKVYDACPYCLTEITVGNSATVMEKKRAQDIDKLGSEKANLHSTDNASQTHKPQGCKHYFGYLSKRSSKEKIPEECVICENIVRCMLTSITG